MASNGNLGSALVSVGLDMAAFRQDVASRLNPEARGAGKKAGAELLKAMQTEFRAQQGRTKAALAAGWIDRNEAKKAGQDAARQFNAGIIPELERMRRAGKENTAEYTRLARALKTVGTVGRQEIGGLTGWFTRLSSATKFWISSFLGTAGLAIVRRFFGSTLDELKKFDSALTESFAIMGDVPEHLRRQMARAAREISRDMNLAADEVAKAFYFLASAGLTAEQSIAALPQVAAFAKAGAFDLAAATDLLTDAQTALGLSSKDAQENLLGMERVSDVLVEAANKSNASVQQFSEALTNRAAAALRVLNKDVEEGVAVLAAYADQGVKGATAGEQFSIVLRDLQTRALENRDAFKQYGISVFDATGTVRNVADILAELEAAFDGLSDAQKRAALSQLGFADRSVASLLVLVGTSEKIRDYERALRSAGGITQTVADRQMASIEARLGRVGQKWQDTKRFVGEFIALPIAEHFLTMADAIISTETPLDRAISNMRRLNSEAAALLEARRNVEELRKEIERLERAQAKAAIPTEPLSRGEANFAPDFAQHGYTRQSIGDLTDQELIERRRRATDRLNAAVTKGLNNEILLRQGQIAAFDDEIARRQSLLAATEAQADAQAEVNRTFERFAVSIELADIERQIADLQKNIAAVEELGVQYDEARKKLEELIAQRDILKERLAGPKPEAGPPPEGGIPEDVGGDGSAKQAAETRKRIMQQLADQLFATTATAVDLSLRALDKLQAEFVEAGGKITGEVEAQFNMLRRNIEEAATLDSLRSGFSDLSSLAVTPETVAGMEQLLVAAEAYRDSLADDTNLWRESSLLIAQIETQLEGLQVAKFTAGIRDDFERTTTDLDLRAAQRLIGPEEAKRAAQDAAEAFNVALLETIERLEASGELSETLRRALVAQLKPTDIADPIVRGLQDGLRRRRAELQQAVAEGILSEKVAKQQGDKAAEAFNAALLARIREFQSEGRNEVAAELLGLLEGPNEEQIRQQRISDMREQARAIEDNARAAIQLANAFGILSDESARALESIAQVAAALPTALAGDPGSILSVVGGVASIAKSFFGGDEEAERRHRENLEALERIRLELEGFRETGDVLSRARDAAERSLGYLPLLKAGGGFQKDAGRSVREEFAAAGIDQAELLALARMLGIDLVDENGRITAEGLEALYRATNRLLDSFFAYADTLDGRRAQMEDEDAIFDRPDTPEARAQRDLDILKETSPELYDKYFRGADPMTEEGRRIIEEGSRRFWEDAKKGLVDPALLGLTREEIRDILLNLDRSLDTIEEQGPSGEDGETSSFTQVRSITEVTAGRWLGIAQNQLYWQEVAGRGILSLVAHATGQRVSLPAVSPPTIPLPATGGAQGGGGSFTITFDDINVTVHMPAGTVPGSRDEWREAGAHMGQGFVDRVLEERRIAVSRAYGDARV